MRDRPLMMMTTFSNLTLLLWLCKVNELSIVMVTYLFKNINKVFPVVQQR